MLVIVTVELALPLVTVLELFVLFSTVFPPVFVEDVTVVVVFELLLWLIFVLQLLETFAELSDPSPLPEIVIVVSPPQVGVSVGVIVGEVVGVGVKVGIGVKVGVGVELGVTVGVGEIKDSAVANVLLVAVAFAVNWANVFGINVSAITPNKNKIK